MPGNLQTENIVSDPPPIIVVALTTTPQLYLSLSLSLSEGHRQRSSVLSRQLGSGVFEQKEREDWSLLENCKRQRVVELLGRRHPARTEGFGHGS
jgi:hypothetical protein